MTDTELIYNKTVMFDYIYFVNSIVFRTARHLSPSYARLIALRQYTLYFNTCHLNLGLHSGLSPLGFARI
jgi:hypothetical protein